LVGWDWVLYFGHFLIICYLQNFSKSRGLSDGENLGDLLIGFFDFYGRRFNYTDNVISVKDQCFYQKKSKMWFNERFPDSLSVEDPHNPEIDVGSASYEIIKAKLCFENAYYRLSENMKFPCLSYLVQSDIIRPPLISPFREYIKQIYSSDDNFLPINNNKKNPPTRSTSKEKYPRKKGSWENQVHYRPVIPDNPPLLDKNKTLPSSVVHYPVRKSGSPNRCLNKLDLPNRKTHSLAGLSVIHN